MGSTPAQIGHLPTPAMAGVSHATCMAGRHLVVFAIFFCILHVPYLGHSSQAKRDELFSLFDPNGNKYISLAEVDKGLRDILHLDEVFDCKPAIMRAFQAAKDVNTNSKVCVFAMHCVSPALCLLRAYGWAWRRHTHRPHRNRDIHRHRHRLGMDKVQMPAHSCTGTETSTGHPICGCAVVIEIL